MTKEPSNWLFIPIEYSHTGIKYVRNWESDPTIQPKPCFRCYLSFNLCEWCSNEMVPRTYCSWEQFKINANWKYFHEKKCPKSADEFYDNTWKFGDPKQTYKNFIDNLTPNDIYVRTIPQKSNKCDKDLLEESKWSKEKDFYDPNWRKKEAELIPIPINKKCRTLKSKVFSILLLNP